MKTAIVEAAITVVAKEGVAAPVSLTASTAGVAQGSVFQHFATKVDLLNAAYLHLKAEVDAATLDDLPSDDDIDAQLRHMWTRWMRWGVRHPLRRLTLSRLTSSEQVTQEARNRADELAAAGIEVLQRARAGGALADVPLTFVASVVDALAGTTMDFMSSDPERAEIYEESGFEALRRALT